MDAYELHGKQYPITGQFGTFPIVDIHMISDYKWQKMCLESRIKHHEKYAQFEDVDKKIAYLKIWLEEHKHLAGAVA